MGEGIKTIGTGTRTQRGSERLEAQKPSQRTSGVDMSSRKFKTAITRAHNYTDDNDHNRARATVSKAFGYNDLDKNYRDIERNWERAGSMTPELINRRNTYDDELERRIRRDYGDRGLKAYQRGLS